MPKKITAREYRRRLYEARKYSNFSFDGRSRLTAARKAAISRAYAKVKKIKDSKADYDFIKLSNAKKRGIDIDREFKTGKGVFVPRARGVYKQTYKNGALVQYSKDFIFRTYIFADPESFIKDPQGTIESLPGFNKAFQVMLNVGKDAYLSKHRFDPQIFAKYIAQDIAKKKDSEEFVKGVTLVFERL